MSLLTDDEKRAIFDQIESGKDTPWFERYANALEARLLAKLAVMELPANAPHVMRRIRACESEVPAQVVLEHALRQAYAQGAASQLSAEPFTHYRHYDEQVQPFADEGTVPLFTRKEQS